jgi:ketosteroid isomerase-like protein
MKSLVAVAAVGVVALIAALQFDPGVVDRPDQEAIVHEIQEACRGWIDAWDRNDLDAAMAFFADGIETHGAPGLFLNNLVVYGTVEEVRSAFGQALERRTSSKMMPEEESIMVITNDHAVQAFWGKWNVTNTDGVTTPDYPMSATLVWVREPEGWKIIHLHQTWTQDTQ